MTDHELLLAISAMLDKKMKPLEEGMKRLGEDLENLEGRLIKVEERLMKVENRLMKVEERLTIVETRVTCLEERQKRTEILLENGVLPRLQTIEACYTGTYKRYEAETRRLDAMQQDIDIMKEVLKEHSDKLNKTA